MKIQMLMKVRGDDTVFSEKLGAGIIAGVLVDFPTATEEDLKNPTFIKAVIEAEEQFTKEVIEVITSVYQEPNKENTDIST